jgi:hypothetical protein
VAAVKRTICILALLPAALLILTCAPPFDPDLGAAALLVQKMRQETVAEFPDWTGRTWPQQGAVFIPERNIGSIDGSRGFIMTPAGSGIRIWYAWRAQASGAVYEAVTDGSAWNFDSPNVYSGYPSCTILTAISGATVAGLQLDPLVSAIMIATMNTVSDPPERLSLNTYDLDSNMVGPVAIPNYLRTLGGGIYPSSAGVDDRVFCLAKASDTCWEVQFSLTSTAIGYIARTAVPLPFTNGTPVMERCLFFHDPAAERSFAQAQVNGVWKCWRWTTNPVGAPVEVPGVTRPIRALLTTGELFAVADGMGTVYGADGALKTEFPMGSLRFVMESYIDGNPRVLFSLMTVLNNSVAFYLYSLPTAELAAVK